MNFPPPCENCKETPGRISRRTDGKWELVPCDCEHTLAVDYYRQHKNDYHEPVISTEHGTICVEILSAIPFFPGDSGARTAINGEICAMAETDVQAVWIARRMIRLYSRWPGVAEMRRVFCATFQPLDGIDPIGTSEIYGNGFPNERNNFKSPAALDAPVMYAPRQIEESKK